MASFTERATLELRDKSTAQIKAINKALRTLQGTANSLKNIKIEIKGIATARAQVQALTRDVNRLKGSLKHLKISVGTQGISQAQTQINNLRNSARRPITVTTNYRNAGGGPPGGGGPGRGANNARGGGRARSFLGTVAQGANAGAGGGMGLGLMGGLAAVNPAMLAVAAAAYAAAAALKFIGGQAVKADRANLMMRMAATKPQQDIIQKAVDQYAASPHPLAMTKADMKVLITGMLGDVGGEGKTPEERATSRATAASKIAPMIADKFLPMAYALNPEMTKEAAIKDLGVIVKGLNIASGNLTTATGELSKDGQRVFEGVALAKAMNPLLDSERIRTTLANLKTLAFTMQPESLATLLSSSGDRGVRVANELYQASRSLSGVVDNKALNKALAGLHLLEGGKPILTPGGKVKTGKGAGIIPGSATPVDAEGLRNDPFKWILENILPKVDQTTEKSLTKAEKKKLKEAENLARAEGKSAEEIEAAGKPGRARFQTIMDQMFPGMPATARTALSDAIYSAGQNKSQLEQGKEVLKQNAKEVFDKSMVAQLEQIRTQLQTKAQDFATGTIESLGVTEKLNAISEAIRTGDYGKMGKAMTAAQDALHILTTPQRFAGELLLKGASLLLDGATALWNWATRSDTPEEKAKKEQERKDREALYKPPEQRTIAEVEGLIKRAEDRINERLKILADADKKNVPAASKAPLVRDITRDRAVVTTMYADIGKFTIPKNWGIDQPEMYPTTQPNRRKGESIFPDPHKSGATPTEDLQKVFGDLKTATSTWVDSIGQGPGEFKTVFDTFPEIGRTGGTNFGEATKAGISAGAKDGGMIFGNTAAGQIKAQLSNISINVNANVTGAGVTGDKGARPAD